METGTHERESERVNLWRSAGLEPEHSNTVPSAEDQVEAIEFSGPGGGCGTHVRIGRFRRGFSWA